MKIIKREKICYEVIVKTGLHIGGNKETYGIGGIDSPVIKDPITNQPIIPGSSVKGKIRMLLTNVKNKENNQENIDKAFGTQKTGMTRIIFRDLFLSEESKEKLESKLGKGFYTEIKAENKIDQVNVTANPRFIERVPAGAVFTGECIVNTLEEDETIDFTKLLEDGFQLLENNFLGGSGSRGYGKVEIKVIDSKPIIDEKDE